MLGRVGQRLAGRRARFLFAVGEGVVALKRPGVVEAEAGRGLDALRHRLVDVDALGEGRNRGDVGGVETHVVAARLIIPAGVELGLGQAEQAVGNRDAGGDLVVELVVEDGHAGAQPLVIVVQDREFGRGRGFRHQAGTAQQRQAALGAEAVDPRRQLLQPRGLEALADAALHGPDGAGVPHQIGARTEVRAEGRMVVMAGAQCQGQVVGETPLVLGEDGPLGVVERARHHAVRHFGVPMLAADGEGVVAPLREQFGVEDAIFALQGAAAAGAGDAVWNDPATGFGPRDRIVGFQHAERQAPVVGHGDLIAVELQELVIAAGGGGGAHLALGVVIPLAAHVAVDPQIMVGMQVEGHPPACRPDLVGRGAAAKAGHRGLDARDGLIGQSGLLPLRARRPDRDADAIRDQRPGQIDVAAANIAELVVALQGVMGRRRSMPGVADLAGDDVDHPAHGVGPVQGGDGATHHLDPLDGRDGRQEAGGGLAKAVGRDAAGRVLAAAVDQDQGVVRPHAPDIDGLAARLADGGAGVDAFDIVQDLGDGDGPHLLDLGAGNDADRGGGLIDPLLESRGGDDDLAQFRGLSGRGLGGLGQGGVRGQAEGQGGAGQQARAGRNRHGGTAPNTCERLSTAFAKVVQGGCVHPSQAEPYRRGVRKPCAGARLRSGSRTRPCRFSTF